MKKFGFIFIIGAMIYFAPDHPHRPISTPNGNRMSMNVVRSNTGGPGVLVVEGLVQIGVAEPVSNRPNRTTVFIRVMSENGIIMVDEQVARFNVSAKAGGIEYPIRKEYELPPGNYQVEFLGFDLTRNMKRPDGSPRPMAGSTYWLAVN